jgi:endonuclease YncB( thermonuclease family)
MDYRTFTFWTIIAVLVGTSVFYGINAEKQRRSVQSASGKIESGDLVKLLKVLDGDTLVALREGQTPVTIRLVGIKCFDAKVEKDVATPFAQAAIENIQRSMADRSARVLLNATPKDKHGRYLATLFVDDEDLAIRLVRQGLALVYPVYPFPAMQSYLQEQEQARAGRRGLWSNATVTERALALIREWRNQNQ